MRVYRFATLDSLDDLTLYDEPTPEPQRGELLLRIRAVALNYRDLAVVLGRYVHSARAGLIPCSDAAAEVVAVGEDVRDYAPGDRVVGAFHPRWFGGAPPAGWAGDTYGSGRDGWLAEYKVVPEATVVPLPDTLSDVAGATLPCAAATAWNALSGPVPVRAGHTVLTLGTGGVSIFALQLARTLGARVIATTSSPAKAETLAALGAKSVIDYTETPNWGARVRELTEDRGVDRVIEVGGPATINESLHAVAPGGEVVLIGFLSTDNPGIDYFALKGTTARTRAIAVGDRTVLEEVVRAVSTTGLAPVIDRVFAFDEAGAAFAHLQSGRHVGKIVIRLPD